MPRERLDCSNKMLSDVSIPVRIFLSLLFLASTWWPRVEKAGILKATRHEQDPFVYGS